MAFAFLLSLGFLEAGLRIAGIGFPNFFEPDAFCGSRLRKSTSGVWTSEGHGNVRINSLGFRGPEFSVEKDRGTFRVCVLGDSFIEALQVDEAETFCVQLQTLLNQSDLRTTEPAGHRRQFEVINCGVSGYGTAQELLMLQNYVLPLKPDLVLLAVFPENDIRNNSRVLDTADTRPYFTVSDDGSLVDDMSFRNSHRWLTGNSDYERIKARLVNRSRILQVLQHLRKPKPENPDAGLDSISLLTRSVEENWYVYRSPEESGSPEAKAWAVTERLLARMSEACRNQHAEFCVFNVPTPVQIWPDRGLRESLAAQSGVDGWYYSEERLRHVCDDLRVPFFGLASEMLQVAENDTRFLTGFPNATPGFGHWNREGNAVAASLVFQWLEESLRMTTNADVEELCQSGRHSDFHGL